MRSTESGLSSSSGAPRANQERVFGNIRLRTATSEESRSLVTEVGLPPARDAQPRHVDPRAAGVFTSLLSAFRPSPLTGTRRMPSEAIMPAGTPREEKHQTDS